MVRLTKANLIVSLHTCERQKSVGQQITKPVSHESMAEGNAKTARERK